MKKILLSNLALVTSLLLTLTLNSVSIEGALYQDPSLSYSGSGKPYGTLSIAGTNPSSEGMEGKRFYHLVTVLGERAEKLANLKSGAGLRMTARLEYFTFENEAGEKQARNKLTIASSRELLEPGTFTTVTREERGETLFVLDRGESSVTLEGIVMANRGLSVTAGLGGDTYTVLTVAYPNPAYFEGGSAPQVGYVEVLVMGSEAEKVAGLGAGWGIEISGRTYLPKKGVANGLAIYADRTLAFSLEAPPLVGAQVTPLEVHELLGSLPEGELEDYLA